MLMLTKLRECGYTIKLVYQSSFIITTAVPIKVILNMNHLWQERKFDEYWQ